MKKIVRVEIVAEIETDTSWYEDPIKDATDEEIIICESEQYHEWIEDHIISEKITVRDKK